jgi:hypothetical protein
MTIQNNDNSTNELGASKIKEKVFMDFVSLIANTGVQFIDLGLDFDHEKFRELRFNYYEGIDSSTMTWWFEELIEIRDLGKYIRKSDLQDLRFTRDRLKDQEVVLKIEDSGVKLFDEEEERTYVIRNAERTLKKFEKKWVPLPYFKNNQINDNLFGPIDWVRIWYEIKEGNTIKAVLAIDTTVSADANQIISPVLNSNPNENKFTICSNEDSILSYLSEFTGCGWVSNWLKSLFEIQENESQTLHLATYFHLLRIFNSGPYFPRVQMLSDQSEIIDLDLSIDIGNSHTCAILFETPIEGDINFNKVKKLSFRDLSHPTRIYTEPFPTRVVFREETFGMKDSFFASQEKFQWPSMVRIGFEAEELINSFQVKRNVHQENRSFYSSPKRYLWDSKLSKQPWNFHDNTKDIPKKVYKKGISEQLKSDGSICSDGAWGATPLYSRRTLMTLLFLELFSQATAQFNSFEFRSTHGKPNARRRLRHVVLSCPTAMVKEEQVVLRRSAEDAVNILKNYSKKINSDDVLVSPIISQSFDIIPSVKDIKLNQDEKADRLKDLDRKPIDWIYDEATCAQLVFLYGLIQHKFDGNSSDLFKLFGHVKEDGRSVLRIGSLDIGGGTSDLMICEYELNYNDATELIPNPLYFESFHSAGDDLLKNIIQSVLIEGRSKSKGGLYSEGLIENKGYELLGTQIYDKLNGFFGKDAATMSYLSRMMRVNFINQIGIPFAHFVMDHANGTESFEASFNDVFKKNKPTNDVLRYFNDHFGFKLEDLQFVVDPSVINRIIRTTFSKLITQIAKLMHAYRCDYVIISGRPCSFKEIETLFNEIHPVQPNRFINLNTYWIGKWYPFSDNNGYVKDPKTIVATGALIGFMATKFFKLNKFKINPQNLILKLNSTANYVGKIKDNVINEIYLKTKPDKFQSDKFKVYSIPHYIGIKNINSPNYPARNIFQIQYNEKYIQSLTTGKDPNSYQNAINRFNSKLPYQITVTREFDVDKEKLTIDEIVDADGDSQSSSLFVMKLITLSDENGYWFDTAEFTLTINSKN